MLEIALGKFLKRLLFASRLSQEEQEAILGLQGQLSSVADRRDLVRPGETVDHALLVAEGLIARYDLMRDGARQITAFHLPGDMCDLHSVVAPTTGWGLTALGGSTVVLLPHDQFRAMVARYPAIAIAFWRDTTLDGSIIAKWVANIGRKNAQSRMAHLFCELGMRVERIEDGTRSQYRLTATQEQIGDALGLTGVHVNRTLRELREQQLVSFGRQEVTIHDWDRLAKVAEFSPAYLLRESPPAPGPMFPMPADAADPAPEG